MIPGITDRVRYQRLGKIRLGEKVPSARGGGAYPKATDHFVFDEGAAAAGAVYAKDGKPCTNIYPILLPGNPKRDGNGWDFSSFWKTSRSAYGKSTGLFCRSTNGVVALRVNKGAGDDGKPLDRTGFAFIQENKLDIAVGEMFELPCPGEECFYFEKKMCKNLGSLDMMLPDVPGFGVWTIQTSSFHSIRNIEGTLQQLAEALGGTIAGIPLGLRLVAQQAQVEGRAKTIFVLELICPHNLQQLAGLRRRALASGGSIMAAIEGREPVPDEFYANKGADLDQALGVAPPAPKDGDIAAVVSQARELGAALGYTAIEVAKQIKAAGKDHIGALIEHWKEQLEAKGGEAQDAPVDDAQDAEVIEDQVVDNGGFDEQARETFAGDEVDELPFGELTEKDRAHKVGGLGPAAPQTEEQQRAMQKQYEAAARNQAPYRREAENKAAERKEKKAEEAKQPPLMKPAQAGSNAWDI